MTRAKATILHVEDDANDRLFVERAFKKAGAPVELRAVASGEEAVSYLSAQGAFADRKSNPAPAFILLDLKLTGMSGFDILKWVRAQGESKLLPIAVLTSSREGTDVRRAYEAGATTYFVKPPDTEDLHALIKCLADYWLVHAKLPPPTSIGA